jgi:uncharacterized membrane protein YeaQ/YmgE (transglycosylase-associated protein family)
MVRFSRMLPLNSPCSSSQSQAETLKVALYASFSTRLKLDRRGRDKNSFWVTGHWIWGRWRLTDYCGSGLFCHGKHQSRRDAATSQSSLRDLNLPAYPRSCQTFEGGDDSILTPEDQWKYTTANWQGGCMLMDIVWFLLIGLVAGWLASLITKREGKGIVNYLIIGVVGAFLGGFLFRMLHLLAYGLLGELFIATVGAVILLFVLRKV